MIYVTDKVCMYPLPIRKEMLKREYTNAVQYWKQHNKQTTQQTQGKRGS